MSGGKSPSLRRIQADIRELQFDPSDRYCAQPMENDMFEWHFTIRGADKTDFDGGIYHGRILLPPDYPFKPPHIMFLTPSGRFEINTKICLSFSAYHPELWQPAWGIRLILEALISFLPTPADGAIGALDWSSKERKRLAIKSQNWECPCCGKIKSLLPKLKKKSADDVSNTGDKSSNRFSKEIEQLQKLQQIHHEEDKKTEEKEGGEGDKKDKKEGGDDKDGVGEDATKKKEEEVVGEGGGGDDDVAAAAATATPKKVTTTKTTTPTPSSAAASPAKKTVVVKRTTATSSAPAVTTAAATTTSQHHKLQQKQSPVPAPTAAAANAQQQQQPPPVQQRQAVAPAAAEGAGVAAADGSTEVSWIIDPILQAMIVILSIICYLLGKKVKDLYEDLKALD